METKHYRGQLVIIGGAEDRTSEPTVLAEFIRLAGGDRARIVVLPVASQHPEEVGGSYHEVFERLGAAEVDVVNISSRGDANAPHASSAIERATGVFFTGGNQLRITSLLGGSVIDESFTPATLRRASYLQARAQGPP